MSQCHNNFANGLARKHVINCIWNAFQSLKRALIDQRLDAACEVGLPRFFLALRSLAGLQTFARPCATHGSEGCMQRMMP